MDLMCSKVWKLVSYLSKSKVVNHYCLISYISLVILESVEFDDSAASGNRWLRQTEFSSLFYLFYFNLFSFYCTFFFINNGLLFLHYSFDLHTIFLVEWLWFFFLGMHSYVPVTSCLALLRIIWPSNGIESVRYCVSVTGIGKWQARQWKNQNAYRED